jgi:hypothetical protein
MNSSTPESAPLPTDGARTPAIALGAAQKSTSVVTSMMVFATPAHVWDSLVFYEGLDEAPPLYLRLLLPRPIRTEGAKSAVGDQATCLYQGGHLLKQLTAIDPQRLYEFKVVEQNLMIGGNVRLTGGCYARGRYRTVHHDGLRQSKSSALVGTACRRGRLPSVPPPPVGCNQAQGGRCSDARHRPSVVHCTRI